MKRREQINILNSQRAAESLFLESDYHRVLSRVDANDVQRSWSADANTAALPHREICDSLVASEDSSLRVQNCASRPGNTVFLQEAL